jgi:hypothetical protein
MSDVKAKSEWVHRFANINQTFEVISSSSTQVIYRNVDGYGQQTMLRHDFLETFRPKSVVDDTFNDDTPAQRKHAHYFKDISDFNEMDTYLFCRVWKVKDDSGALHHALKKLMDAGKRGNKDKIKDVTEARDTLNRYLEIEAMFAEVSDK